jgi:hypothetical protein
LAERIFLVAVFQKQTQSAEPFFFFTAKMSTAILSAAAPGPSAAPAVERVQKAPSRKRKAPTTDELPRKRKAEDPEKRRARKRKDAEESEQPAPKASKAIKVLKEPKESKEPEADGVEEKAAPTPRPASSNPTAHAAACKRKQDAINTRFLALVNSGCVNACNGKVLKRLNRKTVEVNGVRQLAFAQFISEPELRFYMQKFGPVPAQPSRKQSGYMRFSKIKREEWRDNPKYININRQNPNGSKAIVSDIAKEWKSFSTEEQSVFKNMTDEDVDLRISELRALKPTEGPAEGAAEPAIAPATQPEVAM